MNRRKFIKKGALWITGAAAFDIFIPRLKAQLDDSVFMANQTRKGNSGPTIVATDNFVRANSATLGANYTACGDGNSGMAISGNTAVGVASVFTVSAWTANTFHNDQGTIITFGGAPSGQYIYPCVRLTGTATTLHGYCLYIEGSTWGIQLISAGGGGAVLASGSVSPAPGDTFELTAVGTNLTAYHSGSIMTASSGSNPAADSTYASGSCGVAAYNGGVIGNGTTGAIFLDMD